MKFQIVKQAARGMHDYGVFLGVVAEGADWSALGCEAMRLEYEARAERHNGRALQFDVFNVNEGVADQAGLEALRKWRNAQPVVNVFD